MHFQLTVVRHGETDCNKQNLIQSYTDQPLNDKGREQAALLGNRLIGERFTKVFTSGLLRANETAEGILNSRNSGSKFSFLTDERLTERNFGETLEGKDLNELMTKAVASGNPLTYVPPGGAVGETYESVRSRAASFFNDLCQEFIQCPSFVEENVLVVSHGAWMTHFLEFLATEPNYSCVTLTDEKLQAKDYLRPIKNTAIFKFDVEMVDQVECKIKLVVMNDHSHLQE